MAEPDRRPAIVVRPAEPADAEAIADVHARSWPPTYRGLLPDQLIDDVVAGRDRRAEVFGRLLSDKEAPQRIWVLSSMVEHSKTDARQWSPVRRQWIALAAVAAVASMAVVGACGSRAPTAQQSVSPPATPALTQWPPFAVREHVPPGLSLAVTAETIKFENHTGETLWLWPGVIERWEGGNPWVVTDAEATKVERVDPGEVVERRLDQTAAPLRYGVRVYDRLPDANTEPWFLWTEVRTSGISPAPSA